jgi:hypothetical protein
MKIYDPLLNNRINSCGRMNYLDSKETIRMEFDHINSSLELEIFVNLDQELDDESFGFRDFVLVID